MKTILINALSVTNQSGLHVLAGHLDSLVDAFRVTLIARESMSGLKDRFGDRVDWVDAPEKTVRWLPRTLWEFQCLPAACERKRATREKTARAVQAEVYFTPSGIAASRLSIPQVVLCQNPWALVPAARRRRDALKAWLQRRAYRKTMRIAEVMVFNSKYMQEAYRKNAGLFSGSPRSRPSATGCRAGAETPLGVEGCRAGAETPPSSELVVYQAAEEETRRRAEEWKETPRVPGQICCVSAMAPHKNIETLIRAFEKLTSDLRPLTSVLSLRLVGSWPDPSYEAKIRALVSELGLGEQVHFHGFVSREELDGIYAESQVFCLMSRCESFGIPAIEAQLFGTPVVCSNVCAVPEICGEGGLYCDPDDVEGIADALYALLTDSNHWETVSGRARQNADRFRWEACSQPLVEVFNAELNKETSASLRLRVKNELG